MLSEKDTKLIKTYGLLLEIALPCLAMSFVSIVLWGVLVMVDDLVFETPRFYELGLGVALAFVILNLFLFCYSLLRVKFGTSGERWKRLCEGEQRIDQDQDMRQGDAALVVGTMAAGRLMSRSDNAAVSGLGDATQVLASAQAVGVAVDQTGTMLSNVKAVADHYQVQLPDAKGWIAAVFLVPVLVIVAAYVPEYSFAQNHRETEIETVNAAMAPIAESYEKAGFSSRADNASSGLKDSYWVSAREDDELDTYVLVQLDREGVVKEVSYHMYAPKKKSQKECLALLGKKVGELAKPLAASGASTGGLALTEVKSVPDQLGDGYLKSDPSESFYDSFSSEGVRYYLSYHPKSGSSEAYYYFGAECVS